MESVVESPWCAHPRRGTSTLILIVALRSPRLSRYTDGAAMLKRLKTGASTTAWHGAECD
jgi:hypothetical protein